jgi:hypothetical protein
MTSPPEFPASKAIALEDKTLLDKSFERQQPNISEYTFTNLFVWRETEKVQLSQLEIIILIERERPGKGGRFLYPPLGETDLQTVVRKILALNKHANHPTRLYDLEKEEARVLQEEGFTVDPDRDNWDYVYQTEDLATLLGPRYYSKRKAIKKCLTEHRCEYAALTPEIVKDCLQLQTTWCNVRCCEAVPGLAAENRAIRETFQHFERLDIFGGAVYIDNRLEAFTIAERLNKTTAVIHFEKANPEVRGLYQVINQWFCSNALRKYLYVNREQDLGDEGLRRAKSSYHPHHMVEKYVATLPAYDGSGP